jgi:basic membrane lipoprotein Med (substrate-binding protein (PBP1-ABC) superfamily)
MNKAIIPPLVVAAALALCLAGCTEKGKSAAEAAKEKAGQAADSARAYTSAQKEAYMGQARARLADYDKKIDALGTRARSMSGTARTDLDRSLKDLESERDEAHKTLDRMGSATGKSWMDLKSALDQTMKKIGDNYKKAAAE